MSAYRKEGKFYISNTVHFDPDSGLYYVYVGELLRHDFMELHFTAHGKTKQQAEARAEFMCLLWTAARPGDFKVIDKKIDDILNSPDNP